MCVCVCVCVCVCLCVRLFHSCIDNFLIQKPFTKDLYVCLCVYRRKILKTCYIKGNFIQ